MLCPMCQSLLSSQLFIPKCQRHHCFVLVCVKAAAVFMCQRGLKLSAALVLFTMCDSVPLVCFRPRGGRAVAQGKFSTQQGPD